ncbi:MAG: protein phosphatase 2C domain-containing protein [Bifidobacteriaceae bacterium]|nr:protein phosphatase 2C domain-containing protein [Bifidobacteriaceae bacterium]
MNNSSAQKPLFLYSTTVSDTGTVRSNNQDSSFAGEHIVAICDGMGGHAGGDTASTIAIRSLAHIEEEDVNLSVDQVTHMMNTSILAAHDAIVGKAKRERKLAGMGTTVTTVSLVNGYWVVAHIGDSRAYLLRDNTLIQVTTDHSYVQHLIDTGHITPEEAKNHPQRNVVMRVLGDFDIDPYPDITIRKAYPADRWLLCSDGLCGVLEPSTISEALSTISDQEKCAQHLVSMALNAGSTDNVTAVIADATLALDAHAFDLPHQTPLVGGAAISALEDIANIIKKPVKSAPALSYGRQSPAQRAAALVHQTEENKSDGEQKFAQPANQHNSDNSVDIDTGEIPIVKKQDGNYSDDPNDPDVANAIKTQNTKKKSKKTKRLRRIIISSILAFILLISGATYASYYWISHKYYIGKSNEFVAIYQGIPTNIFGISLSKKVATTNVYIDKLPQNWQDSLDQGITVNSYEEAQSRVKLIRTELKKLQKDQSSPNSSTKSNKTENSANSTTSETQSTGPSSSTSQSGGEE